MKILIVDDIPLNRKLLRVQLESEGHETHEAANGKEALEVLERVPLDVVISDVLMPTMDGFRFCMEVRKHPHLHDLPIIMYTATYTSPSDEKLAMEAGADFYLKKPASIAQIAAALQQVYEHTTAGSTSAVLGHVNEMDVLKLYNEQLINKLEEKNQDLQRSHNELETRVQARTQQLADANQKLAEYNTTLYHLAHFDALTNVLNRRAILEVGEHEFERWQRYQSPFTLFMLDLDNFKWFNDNHGHLTGDKVLESLAGCVQKTIRKVDVLGRYGGEEFLIILPQTPAPGAQIAAENLLREIRALWIQTENAVLNITVSVGLATISSADATFDALLGRADTALYEAKRAGKDRAVTAEANR